MGESCVAPGCTTSTRKGSKSGLCQKHQHFREGARERSAARSKKWRDQNVEEQARRRREARILDPELAKVKDSEHRIRHRTSIAEGDRRRYSVADKNRTAPWQVRRLMEKYGLTHDAWVALLRGADHRCQICGSTDRLVVDHCHETGRVRGILCNRCNLGLGMLGDSCERLFLAIEYLCNDAQRQEGPQQ